MSSQAAKLSWNGNLQLHSRLLRNTADDFPGGVHRANFRQSRLFGSTGASGLVVLADGCMLRRLNHASYNRCLDMDDRMRS